MDRIPEPHDRLTHRLLGDPTWALLLLKHGQDNDLAKRLPGRDSHFKAAAKGGGTELAMGSPPVCAVLWKFPT